MSKNRTGVYAALAVAGAGGYYLYRAGGDPNAAKEAIKHDADRARNQTPNLNQAERAGEKTGADAQAQFQDAKNAAVDKAQNAQAQASGIAHDGINKLDEYRQDASSKLRTNVDKFDNAVEEKAAEAKGSVSGWFGGKK
ncbi:hypothetical protein P170DRAFT_507764 [Aspergillus steynii IBT 23096]|uniref:Calcofluor white hypersensitive protein n=1 Tax=Aspergillus steynii IBT 23096 TaxID=1392250 RepID=A0A2I2GJJ7_9EURO|nr:uncharacterized protein P170DRAFT_507764 [Aspergillus steynii IBT 23096]PLB53053.1 hypothetical protein P170DRAFT_507764 [Aspergillus steynii IBT 23096]